MVNNWRFDHLGCLVDSVEDAVIMYLKLGYEIQVRRIPGMPVIGLARKGDLTIQLHDMAGSVVSKGDEYYKKHGEGINHIGFDVDNIEEAVAELKQKGFRQLTDIDTLPNGKCTFVEGDGSPGDIIFEIQQLTMPWW